MSSFWQRHKLETYNVGFIQKPLDAVLTEGIGQGDIRWMRHNYKDRFFADPFLIKRTDDVLYILCEEFIFWEKKGKITLLEISASDFSLLRRKVLIDEPFHLSFPNCEENGNTVVVETGHSGSSFEYTIDTARWEVLSRKEILREPLIDVVFYPDGAHRDWLFCTKLGTVPKADQGDLYLYRRQDEDFVSVSQEPLRRDTRLSRAAGRFFQWKNHVCRPVQDCTERYGYQTVILDFGENPNFEQGYKPQEVTTLNSFKNPPFDKTFHTFNVYDGLIVVDGSTDVHRFLAKTLYKHLSWYCRIVFPS